MCRIVNEMDLRTTRHRILEDGVAATPIPLPSPGTDLEISLREKSGKEISSSRNERSLSLTLDLVQLTESDTFFRKSSASI